MRDVLVELDNAPKLHSALVSTTQGYEALLKKYIASNRAMHEHFLKDLEVHELTKGIFRECVEMMRHIHKQFLDQGTYTDKGTQQRFFNLTHY
jgi:hypothetical protein